MSKAVIVGVGQSVFSWESGVAEISLAVDAIRNALADAGLEMTDIDGVVRASIESTTPMELVSVTGMRPLAFAADDGTWGGFAGGVLNLARLAVESGRANVVVAFRAFNGRSMMRLGRPLSGSITEVDGTMQAHGNLPVGGEFTAPYGLVSPAQVFALWANIYMERYGISLSRMQDGLAAVAMHLRRMAQKNPCALLRNKPLDREHYDASPVIAQPLRKADICLESDGACAVIIANEDIARNCRSAPVELVDTYQYILPGYQNMWLMEPQLPPAIPRTVVPDMLARHGLVPGDLDVLGLYDATSFAILCDVEAMGLCEAGEGVDWVRESPVPYNTSGGQLAEVYLQGMGQIAEVVKQLRGEAISQVAHADYGFVGSAALMSGALLKRGLT